MSQFIYRDAENPESPLLHSFNMDLVIRSVELPNRTRIVLLNDLHEQVTDVPQMNKLGKVVKYVKQRQAVQSEILLNIEDSARFVSGKLTI